MELADRKARERDFHDKRFAAGERRRADRFYKIAAGSYFGFQDELHRHAVGKKVLEFGCGADAATFDLAERGSSVTGIDISPVAIDLASREARHRGLSVDYRLMNAERLDFEADSFDVVCGSGILHHLELDRAFYEISRVLRPDGIAIFSEPLGHNPVINAYRDRTPEQRTSDEHPLVLADFRDARDFFSRVDVRYFHLTTLAAIPFADQPYVRGLSGALDALDRVVFAMVPPLRRYAWLSVVTLSGPRI